MRPLQVLHVVFDRVSEANDAANAVFTSAEVKRWPAGTVIQLLSTKLITPASEADTVICGHCEENCVRPITCLPAKCTTDLDRIVWQCELRNDLGYFEGPRELLRRWVSTRRFVAEFVGRELGLSIKHHEDDWRRCRYALLQIGDTKRTVSLELLGAARLKIGSLSLPLTELVEWEAGGPRIDPEALIASHELSDDRYSGNKRYQPSIAVREESKLLTAIRNTRLQRDFEQLERKHPKLSKSQLVDKLRKTSKYAHLSPGLMLRTVRRTKN